MLLCTDKKTAFHKHPTWTTKQTFPQDQDLLNAKQKTIEYSDNLCLKTRLVLQRSILDCAFHHHKWREGSYTIEAAIALPVFMIAVISLFIFLSAGVVEARLQSAMETAGRKAAYYFFACEELYSEYFSSEDAEKPDDPETDSGILKELEEELAEAAGGVLWAPISETLIRSMVLEELDGEWANSVLVDGGKDGITFIGSCYNPANETIVIKAAYDLKTPFFNVLDVKIPISLASVHRVWSGKSVENTENEELVYITETGTVYHTSLNCTHLKLSIREVSLKDAKNSRNEGGGRYSPCERCGAGTGNKVFITDYGDRYHYDRNCSGLKRSIQSIPLSQVGDRPLCQKCAKTKKE